MRIKPYEEPPELVHPGLFRFLWKLVPQFVKNFLNWSKEALFGRPEALVMVPVTVTEYDAMLSAIRASLPKQLTPTEDSLRFTFDSMILEMPVAKSHFYLSTIIHRIIKAA